MSEETITEETTPETQPDGGNPEGGSDGESTGGSVREAIGAALGKTFETDEMALKSIKDTQSYVGKRVEDIKAEIGTESIEKSNGDFVSREEFEENNFYSKNPEYEPYKKIVNSFREDGKSLSDTVDSDNFKEVYDKVKSYDETQKSRSVLQSNPRLSSASDKMTQAKEAVKEGNNEKASELAVGAVIDAFES
jgi:hypothetical protein